MEVGAGPLSISLSCEGVEVELATAGPLKGFASVEASWEGKVTVYAGAKQEVGGIGPIPEVSAQEGIYITADKNGVTDIGARVKFEVAKEAGGVKVKQTLDSMDFSLMPRVR